ncbi:MAG: class I SAM-dependent methyltransferase [Dehalococcoidia bacterium]
MRLPVRLVRFAFGLLYGPFAPIYDWVSRTFFLGQWVHWQQAALLEAEGRILEIGSGTGALQQVARDRGLDWTALERSPQMIREARRRLGSARLVRADARALPLRGGTFDRVVSTFPSEYILSPTVLAEIARVLQPDGAILVVPLGVLRPDGMFGRLLDRFHLLVYGDAPPPHGIAGPAGVTWTACWVDSPHGRALLLIGRR